MVIRILFAVGKARIYVVISLGGTKIQLYAKNNQSYLSRTKKRA